MTGDGPEATIRPFLEEGEEILWCGRPDAEALVRSSGKEGRWRRRWAEILTYALTTRRFLIIEKAVTESYGPRDIPGDLEIEEREPGVADVIWDRKSLTREQARHTRGSSYAKAVVATSDWIDRERCVTAFKALRDAPSIKAQIEEWRAGAEAAADEALERFLSGRGGRSGCLRVENPDLGLVVEVPDDWRVLVRWRLGEEKAPGEAQQWNVVRAESLFDALVEISVEDAPHTRKTLKSATKGLGGLMSRFMIGKVVDIEESVSRGGLHGYSVTRRLSPRQDGTGRLRRDVMLHDGRREVSVRLQWADGNELQLRALAAILDSMRFR